MNPHQDFDFAPTQKPLGDGITMTSRYSIGDYIIQVCDEDIPDWEEQSYILSREQSFHRHNAIWTFLKWQPPQAIRALRPVI